MSTRSGQLTAKSINTKPPGRHADGRGLYLLVKPSGARSWVFRYMLTGKRHDLGLGPAGDLPEAVTLAEARDKLGELRKLVRDGADPAAARKADKAARAVVVQPVVGKTFREVAALWVADREAGWKNAKHEAQVTATLTAYAYPHFGDVPVADIVTGHVMEALRPIWTSKPETATRVRGRIEGVLDYATAMEYRTGPNPARWKGHLATMLPARAKVAAVEHHAALPWGDMGAFMADLRKREGASTLALEFAILTAARTGEVIGATWGELDMEAKVWTVPASRMKAAREHRVPLTDDALAVLAKAKAMATSTAADAFVFQGQGKKAGLSNMALLATLKRMGRDNLTTHGFRSTFRDWCSEATAFDRDTAEAALAHTVRDKVEAAYRRGDQLDKRRKLMEAWAEHCGRALVEAGT